MARKKRRRPHGAGTIITRGNRTIIQFFDVDGRRRTKSLPDPDTARRLLAEAVKRVQDGIHGLGAPKTDVTSLSQLAGPWLAARAAHASHYDDVSRWTNHLEPLFGSLAPDAVDISVMKTSMVALRTKGLSKATVKLCMALLSSFFSDLVEDGHAKMNPTRMLSKKTRREFLRSDFDPKDVPFVKDPIDIQRVYARIDLKNPSVAIAYAVGALGGLRTSEVRALDWASVDMAARTITVREQVQRRRGRDEARLTEDGTSQVKDGEVRIVPILDSLYPLLEKQRAITGGVGLVCPPVLGGAARGARRFLGDHRMAEELRQALADLGIEPMIWYRATRHTFASQWVLGGGTLEKLQEVMGHSSVVTTERYSHLIPGRFSAADRGRIQIGDASI